MTYLTLAGQAPISDFGDSITKQPGVGSLALIGLAPTLGFDWVVAPSDSSLALTGYAPSLREDYLIPVGTGSLSLTGLIPTFEISKVIPVGVDNLILTGYAVTLKFDWVITPSVDLLVLTGYTPLVIQTGISDNTPGPPIVVAFDDRTAEVQYYSVQAEILSRWL